MAGELESVEIIERRAAQATVVHVEAAGLDDIHRHIQARCQSEERPGILGDVRLEEDQAHVH
jgi:hypothetical protein